MAAQTPTIKRQLSGVGAVDGHRHQVIRCCKACARQGTRAADVAAAAYPDLYAVAPTNTRSRKPITNVPVLRKSDGCSLVSRARWYRVSKR